MHFKEYGVEITPSETYPDVLDAGAIEFLSLLAKNFTARRNKLLQTRASRQAEYDEGLLPDFDPMTKRIRESDWVVAEIPAPLQDRRVEITGPPDRKMVINALNAGASVFMADFEDSLSPTWDNVVVGQRNMRDAVRKTITYQHPTKGLYHLNENIAELLVRPRGLHLDEAHFKVSGEAIPASLFDFGLYMYHNAEYRVSAGAGPYFYLPKLEHYLEARWWNDVFEWSQEFLAIPQGSIRATVLLETLPAAFQMNEILWELRDHSAGLNCGRWDYIFSYIKTLRNHSDRVTPDRGQIGMTTPFMKAYSQAVIQTCHRRGIHAMGGMAAQIPIRGDEDLNASAISKVLADKKREATDGHDGTWVAHPGLVSLAKGVFDDLMPAANQVNRVTNYKTDTQEQLLETPAGSITLSGLQQNVDVGVRYLAAWLSGQGCVPLYNLMEDAATAEISRTQVWQWIKYQAPTESGVPITKGLVGNLIMQLAENEPELTEACELFLELCVEEELTGFLTLPAYNRIKDA